MWRARCALIRAAYAAVCASVCDGVVSGLGLMTAYQLSLLCCAQVTDSSSASPPSPCFGRLPRGARLLLYSDDRAFCSSMACSVGSIFAALCCCGDRIVHLAKRACSGGTCRHGSGFNYNIRSATSQLIIVGPRSLRWTAGTVCTHGGAASRHSAGLWKASMRSRAQPCTASPRPF